MKKNKLSIIDKIKFYFKIKSFRNEFDNYSYNDTANIIKKYKKCYDQLKAALSISPNQKQYIDEYFQLKTINDNKKNFIEITKDIETYVGLESKDDKKPDEVYDKIDRLEDIYNTYIYKTTEMNSFLNNVNKYKKIIKLHDEIKKIIEFKDKYNTLLNTYISRKEFKEFNEYISETNKIVKNLIKTEGIYEYFGDYIEFFKKINKNFTLAFKDKHNKEIVVKEKVNPDNKDLFLIDGKYELDDQQKEAVIMDEDFVIITAGAGSGKTATLTSKINYLINRKNVNPKDILLISFTKKATEEIADRVKRVTNTNTNAKTFHALGYDILKVSEKKIPDVNTNFDKIIDRYFIDIYNGNISEQMKNVITYLREYQDGIVLPYYYSSYSDYVTDLKNKDLQDLKQHMTDNISLSNEVMKSKQEVKIADFLFLNGIEYIYEDKYKYAGQYSNVAANGKIKKDYRPDFYLPEYDLYLEHFGVNKKGKLPWLTKIEEEQYIESMKWKRDIQEQFGTKMLESYSWWDEDGKLVEKVDKLLTKNGVKKKPIDIKDVYNKCVLLSEDITLKSFRNLVKSFIALYKTNNSIDFKMLYKKVKEINSTQIYSENINDNLFLSNNKCIQAIINKVYENSNKSKNQEVDSYIKSIKNFIDDKYDIFLHILEDIYNYYEDYLAKNKQIDFNDMINCACDNIDKYTYYDFNKYKYIFIDEYQDIALNRFELYKKLQENVDAKVTVVGDDWQSIYRFAGSDIELFKDFDKYFDEPLKLKIENTYRNSQELLDITSKFILKNNRQLPKKLKSNKNLKQPIKLMSYVSKGQTFKEAVDLIIKEYGDKSKILVLGRNNFDCNFLNQAKTWNDSVLVLKDIISNYEELNKNYGIAIKKIYSNAKKDKNGKIIELDDKAKLSIEELARNIYQLSLDKKIELIDKDLKNILVINTLLNDLIDSFEVETIYDNDNKDNSDNDKEQGTVKIIYKNNPNVDIEFLTVHRAKGKEADNVIVLNNNDNKNGFPNQIEDDPILQLLIKDSDAYPFAEERRLFYVALTRTKNRVYLMYNIEKPSCFINELKDNYKLETINASTTVSEYSTKCPSCQKGYLVYRSASFGNFLGCSNYPACRYRVLDTQIKEEPVLCNKCMSGFMINRIGPYGAFYGCSNYPSCTNTMKEEVYDELTKDGGFIDNFAFFISNNIKCEKCQKNVKLIKDSTNSLKIECDKCKLVRSLEEKDYTYFYESISNIVKE